MSTCGEHEDAVGPPGDESEQRPIPPSIELAWGLREPGTRGPKRALTLAGIVEAGITIAQAEGLDSLSMARVAGELGVGTMSLYRYLSAKDELLTLMVDGALGPPPPPAPVDDWRAGLAAWAAGLRAAYHRHPWSLRVPITGPPLGPNNVAWLDAALGSLAGTPLAEADKLSTVLLLSGFVRNDSTLAADFAANAAGELVMPGYGAILTRLTQASQFPALHRAIASGALDDDDDLGREFTFGLDRILDGVEVLISRTI